MPAVELTGRPAAGSKFTSLKIGMSMAQVTNQIGQPTDQGAYITGKAWIPFYFGSDAMRMEELYKGQGRITYTGVGATGANFNVYQITYDPSEDGYNNR